MRVEPLRIARRACRFCGCTEEQACVMPEHLAECWQPPLWTCTWLTADVCSAPGCLARLADEIAVGLAVDHGEIAAGLEVGQGA